MVAAFDFCLHGKGGAAPSIDTAMHGAGGRRRTSTTSTRTPGSPSPPPPTARPSPQRASATGSRGCRGAARASSSVSTSRRSSASEPEAIGVHPRRARHHGLGRHLGGVRGASRWRSSRPPQRYIDEHGRAEPFGPVVAGREPLPAAERRERAAALFPVIRGLVSTDRAAGRPLHRQRRGAGLPRPREARRSWRRWAPPARTTSCARRSSRWCSTCRPTAPIEEVVARLRGAARRVPRGLPRLLRAPRRRRTAPPMRGADPAIVLVPGVGMFSFGANKQTARVAGEFYVNAINVMRGAEALSTYAPIAESREVPHRVLGARGGQARADAQAQAARHAHRAGDRRRVRASAGRSRTGWPPRAPASSSPTSTREARADRGRASSAAPDVAIARRRSTSPTRRRSPTAIDAAVLRVRRRRPGGQQRRAVALQAAARDHRRRLGPAARRHGQGLLPGLARGRPGHDRAGPGRRHRLHRQQERVRSPARTTSPTARPRPTRRTRCGCSRPSSASTASGSTASTPTGWCAAPGIFAGGWGAERAAVYGVAGGGARRVLRAAHAPEARGAARARRRRGVRARGR